MSRSPKLALYAAFAAASFIAALALGRPELAGLGAPFALVLALGLSLPPPRIETSVRLSRGRVLEGDQIEVELSLSSSETCEVQLALALPSGIASVGEPKRFVLGLARERPRTVTVRLGCERWGAYRLGEL
ncbi:MAG: hypothetical protein WBQ14_03115, partial [Gaiellaceae bacterium]